MDSLPDLEQIARDSAELRRLNSRLHDAARERGADGGVRHQMALGEFVRRFDQLAFPGGQDRYESFIRGDLSQLEAVLRFLEADPFHFRSGYMKEALWRRLSHLELGNDVRKRLEQATLRRITRPISRDYWYQCRAMSRIAQDDFRRDVLLACDEESDKLGPAHCLSAYLESPEAGDAIRRLARDRWLAPWHQALRQRFGHQGA